MLSSLIVALITSANVVCILSKSVQPMQVVKSPDGSFIDGIKGRFLGAVEGLIQKGKDAAAAAIGELISSAKDYVMANGAGDIFGAIGSGIDSALLSLEQIDFNPSSMW